jgi:predicted  nucleic acid-binding Zn-ribbon protein
MDPAEKVIIASDRVLKTERQLHHATGRTQQELVRIAADMESEIARIKMDVHALEEETHATVEAAKRTIGSFHAVIKERELARLKQRIDAWAPEKRITREQFKRMLSDA